MKSDYEFRILISIIDYGYVFDFGSFSIFLPFK